MTNIYLLLIKYFFDPWSADQGDPLVNNPLSESKEVIFGYLLKPKQFYSLMDL